MMDYSEKQIQILEASLALFAEKGYASVSTNQIAKLAGVAEGTIFHYFKTKKELLIATSEYIYEQLLGSNVSIGFQKMMSKEYDTLDELLIELFKERVEFINANMPKIKVLIQEIPFHSELFDQIKNNLFIPSKNGFLKILEDLNRKGQLGEVTPEVAFKSILTTFAGYLFLRYLLMPELQWNEDEEKEYLVKFIKNGLKG